MKLKNPIIILDDIVKDMKDNGFNVQTIPFGALFGYNIIKIEIGEGKNTFLGTYGMHGNEQAACHSFIHSPFKIKEQLSKMKDVKYVGIYCNPFGGYIKSRYTDDVFEEDFDKIKSVEGAERRIDLNRIWSKDFGENKLFRLMGAKALKDIVDKVIKENNIIFHVDHHGWGSTMPSGIMTYQNLFKKEFVNYLNKLDETL